MGTNVGTSSTHYLKSVSRWGNFLKRHVLYNACFNGIWNQEKTKTKEFYYSKPGCWKWRQLYIWLQTTFSYSKTETQPVSFIEHKWWFWNDFISQNLLYSSMERPLDYSWTHSTGLWQALIKITGLCLQGMLRAHVFFFLLEASWDFMN